MSSENEDHDRVSCRDENLILKRDEAGEKLQDVEGDSQGKDGVVAKPAKQKGGIYKLFDLIKGDLGQDQAEEMKTFYEKMSQSIKELCHF